MRLLICKGLCGRTVHFMCLFKYLLCTPWSLENSRYEICHKIIGSFLAKWIHMTEISSLFRSIYIMHTRPVESGEYFLLFTQTFLSFWWLPLKTILGRHKIIISAEMLYQAILCQHCDSGNPTNSTIAKTGNHWLYREYKHLYQLLSLRIFSIGLLQSQSKKPETFSKLPPPPGSFQIREKLKILTKRIFETSFQNFSSRIKKHIQSILQRPIKIQTFQFLKRLPSTRFYRSISGRN